MKKITSDELKNIVGNETIITSFSNNYDDFIAFLKDLYFAKLEIINIKEICNNGAKTVIFNAKKSNRDELFTYNLKQCKGLEIVKKTQIKVKLFEKVTIDSLEKEINNFTHDKKILKIDYNIRTEKTFTVYLAYIHYLEY